MNALWFLSPILLLILYLSWRNQLVYRTRMAVLFDERYNAEENLRQHARLPSYNVMLWQVWRFRWDVEPKHEIEI